MDDRLSQIKEAVAAGLTAGKTKEELYSELLNRGFLVAEIEGAFAAAQHEQGKERREQRTIMIVLTVGALFVGAGIFSFVASNWDELSQAMRVLILFATHLGFLAAGWYLVSRGDYQKTGQALLFAATLVYGANIFLLAQIFNIRGNWPDGFLLWMLGALALGYALSSFVQKLAGATLAIIGIYGVFTGVFEFDFSIFFDSFTSPLLLIIVALTLMAAAYAEWRRTATPNTPTY